MTTQTGKQVLADSDIYEVGLEELPLSCPRPDSSLWNMHPRVFLDIKSQGSVRCPYCGSLYRLKDES